MAFAISDNCFLYQAIFFIQFRELVQLVLSRTSAPLIGLSLTLFLNLTYHQFVVRDKPVSF